MSISEVVIQEKVKYAELKVRLLAHIIDIFAILPISFISVSLTSKASSSFDAFFISLMLDIVLPILLTVLCWMQLRATPGKYLLKLEVLDSNTFETLTVKQSFLRYLGYLVGIASLGVGFIAIAFDEKSRGWHDKLSGSCVVYKANQPE